MISDHFLDQCSLTSTGITLRTEHLEGWEEMNFATKKLTGVRTMIIRVIHTFLENMKSRVPMMVMTPENSCVNPRSIPSERIIRICDDTADDITGAVSVQVGQRKLLDMADGSCTDILYCAVGHTVVDDTHDPGAMPENTNHDKNTGKIESHSCKINFVGSNDLINGITKKYGNIQLQNYSELLLGSHLIREENG